MRTTRKYVNRPKNVDILLLSPIFGLISPTKKIPYHEPLGGSWKNMKFSKDKVKAARESNLATMRILLSKQEYEEIYLNVGKSMLQLLGDFEQIVPKTTKITFAHGRGIGPKVAHMKNWLELQVNR